MHYGLARRRGRSARVRKCESRDGPVAREKVNRGDHPMVDGRRTHVFFPEGSDSCAELAQDVLASRVPDAQLDGRDRRRRTGVVG